MTVPSSEIPPVQPTTEIPPVQPIIPVTPPPVLEATTSSEIPKPKSSIILKLFFVLLLLIGIGGAGGYYALNYYFVSPLKIIGKSLENISLQNSFTVDTEFAEDEQIGKISFSLDYKKDFNLLSQAEFKLSKIQNDNSHNFSLKAIYSNNDIFLLPNYSKYNDLESQLKLAYPEFFSLQTYQMLLPVLKGQTWLHIPIPKDESPTSPSNEIKKYDLTEKQQKDLETNFIKTIIVRSFDRNFSENGINYYKINIGLNKTELLNFVDSFKDLSLDIKVSDLNDMKRIIQSSDGWDDDLVQILIEKKSGNLRSLTISIPEISEEAMKGTTTDESAQGMTISPQIITENLNKFFQKNKNGKLIYIGKIVFSNYNTSITVQKPSDILEFEKVMSVAQVELMPLIQSLYGGIGQPNTKTNTPTIPASNY